MSSFDDAPDDPMLDAETAAAMLRGVLMTLQTATSLENTKIAMAPTQMVISFLETLSSEAPAPNAQYDLCN